MNPEQTDISDRSRGTAIPLAVLLGVFGGHRFYVGKTGTGILQLCTLGGIGLWWLYDIILLASGEFRDVEGRRVTRWSTTDTGSGPQRLGSSSEAVREEFEVLRGEMLDLAERVDFMERMLAQVRERDALPPHQS